MEKEFNVQKELENVNETTPISETLAKEEHSIGDEYSLEAEENQPKEIEEKKSRKINVTALSGSLIAVVAAATVGITNLLNVNMDASFNDEAMEYRDGKLVYEIAIKDMTEDEVLTLYWYENNTVKDQYTIVDEDGDGIVKGYITLDNDSISERLAANPEDVINYKFTLKGMVGLDVERSFDNYTLEIRQSEVRVGEIYRKCNCGVTGYYNFQVDFDDPYGAFYDFEAYIVGENNVVKNCEWTENKHEMQQIYVADIGCINGTLNISWKSTIQDKEVYTYSYDVQF